MNQSLIYVLNLRNLVEPFCINHMSAVLYKPSVTTSCDTSPCHIVRFDGLKCTHFGPGVHGVYLWSQQSCQCCLVSINGLYLG